MFSAKLTYRWCSMFTSPAMLFIRPSQIVFILFFFCLIISLFCCSLLIHLFWCFGLFFTELKFVHDFEPLRECILWNTQRLERKSYLLRNISNLFSSCFWFLHGFYAAMLKKKMLLLLGTAALFLQTHICSTEDRTHSQIVLALHSKINISHIFFPFLPPRTIVG